MTTATAVDQRVLLLGTAPPRGLLVFVHPVHADEELLLPGPERVGLCYELAARWVTCHLVHDALPDNTVVIHGSIQGLGYPRIGHAWLEFDLRGERVMHDPVSLHTTTPEHWAKWASAEVVRRITPAELVRHALDTDHYGPWHQRPFGLEDCSHGDEYETCDEGCER